MNVFNPEAHRIETASALEVVCKGGVVERYAAYVGLDVGRDAPCGVDD